MSMKIALVGTGFVADYYMTTLANYPALELAGVWDRDAARLAEFSTFHDVKAFSSLTDILADSEIGIVVNLTNPESHFPINQAILDAGKHVYCEKPLAMEIPQAESLVKQAEQAGLTLCSAPANALSDAWLIAAEQLRLGKIGKPRLVYAEMEDGPVFRAPWQQWKSRSGAAWPGLHEFEIGCTLEHAGYALSWLVRLFGPVEHVSAFSALTFREKGPGTERISMGKDFSVGCLRFQSGVIARLTCGLAAPRDRSLTIIGEKGTLAVRDLWDNHSPVHLSADDERSLPQKITDRLEARFGRRMPFRLFPGRKLPASSGNRVRLPPYPSRIDFARGIMAQAESIAAGKAPIFSGRVALHLTELALVLHEGRRDHTMRNCFDAAEITIAAIDQ